MGRGGYRAVLSGIGGDEFLGGVPDPTALLADLILQFRPLTFARQLIAWSLVKRRPVMHLLWQAFLCLLPSSLGQHLVRRTYQEAWITKDIGKHTKLANGVLDVDQLSGFRLPSRRSYILGVVLMANKMAKRTASQAGLEETRYPYLDQNLLEFALSIPSEQLLRPGERRSLMRRSLIGIVPAEVLSRRTKQFGARTLVLALERNFEELQTAFESPLTSSMGYINRARFLETISAARNGRTIPIIRVLKGISLEFWLRDLEARALLDHHIPSPSVLTAESQGVNA